MVSVVIPTLDEARNIGPCLASLLPEAESTGAELLVVDGGSSDDTVNLARRTGVRVVTSPVGRGRQMNEGTRLTHGSLLVFHPADTTAPPGTLARLQAIDTRAEPVAGGFHQRFDRTSPTLRALSAVHNLRARLTGVFYGDQIPFVRRDLFSRLGGFREDIDMEDAEFGTRLGHHCSPRMIDLTATTSSRRFDRAGDLGASLLAVALATSWTLLRSVPRSRTFFTPVR